MKTVSNWLLKKLSRVTSSGRFVPEIDGLRFIAIMSVVLFHMCDLYWKAPGSTAWQWAGNLAGTGWFGVELFFIISGLILSMPFAEEHLLGRGKLSLKKYFVRRLTRLEPPYVINLVLLLGLMVFIRHEDFRDLLPHFLASLCYVHNQVFNGGSRINPAAWSLEVEVQFYLLAPILCLVYRIRGRWLRRAVVVGGMMVSLWSAGWLQNRFPGSINRVQGSLISMLPYFLVGFLLTDVYLVSWKGAPRKSYAWDIIGVAAWASIPAFLLWDKFWPAVGISLPEPLRNGWELLYTVGFGALLLAYMAAFRGRILNRIVTFPWLVVIGGMCYTIYLYHQTLLECFRPLFRPDILQPIAPWAAAGQIVLMLALVIACSAVLFVVLEKPFMQRDWPQKVKRFLTARRQPATVPPAVEIGAPLSPPAPAEPAPLRK